jgi:hypothetical protein
VFNTNVEWNNITAIEGEIGIVIEIYNTNLEDVYFDLNIQLSDGGMVPVWTGEIELLE